MHALMLRRLDSGPPQRWWPWVHAAGVWLLVLLAGNLLVFGVGQAAAVADRLGHGDLAGIGDRWSCCCCRGAPGSPLRTKAALGRWTASRVPTCGWPRRRSHSPSPWAACWWPCTPTAMPGPCPTFRCSIRPTSRSRSASPPAPSGSRASATANLAVPAVARDTRWLLALAADRFRCRQYRLAARGPSLRRHSMGCAPAVRLVPGAGRLLDPLDA